MAAWLVGCATLALLLGCAGLAPPPALEGTPSGLGQSLSHQGRVFQGRTLQSAVGGRQITPIAWLHAGVTGADGWSITLLLLYERTATSGEQVKMDSITLPVNDDGAFSGAYGDFQSVSGQLAADSEQLTFSANVFNGKDQPEDRLRAVKLSPLHPGTVPRAQAYPVTQVLPVATTKPEYTDFWDVTLEVLLREGKPHARVQYEGPEGRYTSEPVPLERGDMSFRGTATLRGRSERIEFSGVFVHVASGESSSNVPNYPILTQTIVGREARPLTEAVGINPILWLEVSSTKRSGVVVRTASFSTEPTARAQVVALLQRKDVISADLDDRIAGITLPPNDPYFRPAGQPGQYPYPTMNGQLCCTGGPAPVIAADAWGVPNATGQGVTVAVLDTGVFATHPDLAHKVQGGHNSLSWPWWIDWLRLWIPANWRTDSADLHGHGTGVAGVITANRNNSIGVAGTAELPEIIPVRVLNRYNGGTDASFAEGLVWLLDNDLADIINTSLINQGPPDPNVAELVRRAVEQGRLVVAGSGNSAQSVIPTPAGLPDVISVASSETNDDPTDYSGYGKNLDLLAPGGDSGHELTVLWLPGRCQEPVFTGDPAYCMTYGTSFATPYASAVGAMLLSATPNLRRSSPPCVANPKSCVAQASSLLQSTGLVVNTPIWAPDVTQVRLIQAHTALVPGGIVTAPPPSPTLLTSAGCPNFMSCQAPGLPLNWTAAGAAPAGLALQGYLIYRNGELQLAPGTTQPIIVMGTAYHDTTLPVNGGALVPGRYTYTITALYRDAAGAYRESFSANAVTLSCMANACH